MIEVVQSAPATTATISIGDRILPRDAAGNIPSDAEDLTPQLATGFGVIGALDYFGESQLPDGTVAYYAERENDNPTQEAMS